MINTMEKALMVGLVCQGRREQDEEVSLDELARLLDTAGGQVVGRLIQRRPAPDPGTLIGSGKVAGIAAQVAAEGVDLVVINHDLSPGQQRKLETLIPARVIDRTRVILDIFARRAHTREGQLQVELAQLMYLLPRMTEKFGTFEQQTGGIGTRGPGERKLEVDRRHIRQRITRLKADLEGVVTHRALRRDSRSRTPLPTVALVGYTNAGKSTLLNALHQSNPPVYADDKLFATLDPTVRRVKLAGGRPALFVDTVGFVRDLPTHVVAAFRATLEEVAGADALIHVQDAADPEASAHGRVVEKVLGDLGAARLPRISFFNKADRLTEDQRQKLARQGDLFGSAATGEGLEVLLQAVATRLEESLVEHTVFIPHDQRRLLARVFESGRLMGEKPVKGGTRVRLKLDEKNYGALCKALKKGALPHESGK